MMTAGMYFDLVQLTDLSISYIPSKHLKCPTCFKTPDYSRIQNIITDAMAYRDNRPFNSEDPIIVSETEIYCNAECYAIAVVREEEEDQI